MGDNIFAPILWRGCYTNYAAPSATAKGKPASQSIQSILAIHAIHPIRGPIEGLIAFAPTGVFGPNALSGRRRRRVIRAVH
jgi:hypothetical protein